MKTLGFNPLIIIRELQCVGTESGLGSPRDSHLAEENTKGEVTDS